MYRTVHILRTVNMEVKAKAERSIVWLSTEAVSQKTHKGTEKSL